MFGILNDLTARRAALAEGGGDGVPVPDKVIFIFSAAQKNELALLQRPLVADAMCGLLSQLLNLLESPVQPVKGSSCRISFENGAPRVVAD